MTTTGAQDTPGRWLIAACAVLFLLAAALRIDGIDRQGLWSDEAFSLAMATGHSLEHPASAADSTRGDYVESPEPRSALEYKQYLEHQHPPAGLRQVLRAIQLSDTSPPLYYLVLWAWTRLVGTSDAALRLLSVSWFLACFPFIYLLAREIGGKSAILPALLLFSLSPLSIFYSLEGRMYSMLWFLAVALAWLTLSLHRHGLRPLLLTLWIAVGAVGMLTHYFYAFVIAACFVWLMLYPGQLHRGIIVAAASSLLLLILPWYVRVPQIFSSWRVTGNWLYMTSGDRILGALKLPWSLVSFSVVRRWDYEWDVVLLGVMAVLLIAVPITAGKKAFSRRPQLLFLWVAAVCGGPVVFDVLLNSYVTLEPRYVLPGMPAALLIIGCALGRVAVRWRLTCILLILLAWTAHWHFVMETPWRYWEPYKQVADFLDHRVTTSDLVVVHSTPSGVATLARYLAPQTMMYSWVGQLRQRRVPDDPNTLADKFGRIFLVKIHTVAEPAPEETWFREHRQLSEETKFDSADVLVFDNASGHQAAR